MTLPLFRLAAILLLWGGFVWVGRRELLPLCRGLGRSRGYPILLFLFAAILAQTLDFQRDLYPAVSWTMYTERPAMGPRWDLRVVRDAEWEGVSGEPFPFRRVVAFDLRRPVPARIVARASYVEALPEARRAEEEERLREALAELGDLANRAGHESPIRRIQVVRCHLPGSGAPSREAVPCALEMEVEVPRPGEHRP